MSMSTSFHTHFDPDYGLLGSCTPVQSTRTHTLGFHLLIFPILSKESSYSIPGHDLSKLAEFDLKSIHDIQTLGSDMVCKIQHAMDTQFSHSDTGTTLPEDQYQSLIVRVSHCYCVLWWS